MKSIIVNANVDATDAPFEFRNDRDTARGVLTDRITSVTGAVSGTGDEVGNAVIVVFPDDQKKMAFPSRYVLRHCSGVRRRHGAAGSRFPEQPSQRVTSFSLREGDTATLTLTIVQR